MYCFRSLVSVVQRHSQKKPLIFQRIIQSNPFDVKQTLRFVSDGVDDTEELINEICKGDSTLEKKLRILMLEVEVMRQDGRNAPNTIRKDQWMHLLDLQSRNQRSNYLLFLFKNEKSREHSKAKKETRRQEYVKPEESKEFPDDLVYGIQQQSLFLRIRDQSINQFDNYRALQAMISGQSIVIDCSYEENMVSKEVINAAKQMTFVFGDNRIHREPFNLHMCNINMESQFMKNLRKNIPSVDELWFPMNIHTESYLDIFPKEKLVYLTPHCREELTKFDHDAVYIIGCMVDKVNNEPLSLAKAKRDGIKMAKLPLDRYLEWAPGSKKNLNINHMVPILLDLKMTGDWEYALRHIPRRKLMETKILAMQKRLANNPALGKEVMKNFKLSKLNKLSFRDRKFKSQKSLYDDDSL